MVELRFFPLLAFWGFFLFFNLSLSFPFLVFSLASSPHNHTDIEGSLSAPLGKDPAHVAAADVLNGSLRPHCSDSDFQGSHVDPFAIVIYSKRVAIAPATDVDEVTHFA